MRALVYTAPTCLELQDVPEPEYASGYAVLHVRAAGICGSEVEGFLGKSRKRIPPLIMGHEFAGEAARCDDRPEIVGGRYAIQPLVSCGNCEFCENGRTNICPARRLLGIDCAGGFAEYVSVPTSPNRLNRLLVPRTW